MTVSAPPASEPVELRGRQPISRTTIHGWPSIIFGLPFTAAGVAILMLWAGKIEVDPGKVHAPPWVFGVFGFFFLLAGLSFIWHGGIGLRRKAEIRNAKKSRASSPWLWDYPWQALGISDNRFKKVLHALLMITVFAVFLAPFHWWAFVSRDGGTMVKAMVIVFDVIFGLAGGIYLVSNLALFLKYGNSRLRFNNFPFLLGDALSVTLADLPAEIRELSLDLRFIEEKYETRSRGTKRESVVVCYQLYHESRTLAGREVSPSGKLALEWQLPDDASLTTTLSERPARFWELEVKADTPGVDYHSRFLLPVYARG
ncbi:MAG: hypothetical protein GWM98_17635 [Nitrospinaceae bacterium]|nr:hypothetical protein [Nitrospinaceae bacterium]NIR55971.1 hypothetical protein [Nitrospinaceae bacterium]NIS86414.1 hypothetical protein [Nitrospinaceae bacterium]NIT83252.1 hypothetical protein [Nitrospinaceae bacterium]NIU45459.1 hypothetical protein [Nitrospinaceae bacterium]